MADDKKCPLCGSATYVTDKNCAEELTRYCTSQDCDWYGSVNMVEYAIVDKVLGLNIKYDHSAYSSRLRSKERMRDAMNDVGCLVEKEVKQTRAEVLAACIQKFDQYLCSCSTNFVGKPKTEHEKACPKYVVGVLRALQPAAKALEELHSRAYRNGATGAAVWFVKLLHGHPEDPPQMGCKPEAISEKLEELLRKEGEKVRKEALDDVLAFNSGLGCTPQEGYKYLVDALRDTRRLSIEKARAVLKE